MYYIILYYSVLHYPRPREDGEDGQDGMQGKDAKGEDEYGEDEQGGGKPIWEIPTKSGNY